MIRADTVLALQQLLELEDELAYFFRSTREAWEHWNRQHDRRRRERRWQVLQPVVDDLARMEKISDAELEFLAAWARVSAGALEATLEVTGAHLRGQDIGPEAVVTATQPPDRSLVELAELLTGADAATIAEGLGAPPQAVLLEDLRSEAYDELALVTKEFAGRAGVTLPAVALEGCVTIDQSIRAIASLASALCRLLDQATSAQT